MKLTLLLLLVLVLLGCQTLEPPPPLVTAPPRFERSSSDDGPSMMVEPSFTVRSAKDIGGRSGFADNRVLGGTVDLRMKTYLKGPLYVGVELGLGAGHMDKPFNDDRRAMIFATALVAGVSYRLGPITPHLEMAAGACFLGVRVKDENDPHNVRDFDVGWLSVTPRAGFEIWVHPRVSIGAFAGVNTLHENDFIGGLRVSSHLRTFDGQ